ncbi:MAG: SDR family oxidoreductase [Actinomycetota bacterium]|nr:SDR family oxidoreductase [Actinomycetota bacterium]
MIFVTGATGTVGSALLPRLVGRGQEVRALAHSASSRERVEELGAEAFDGDLDDPESLDRGMAGCDHLFLLSPPHPAQVQREAAAIDAAARAGVDHVVKLSAMGATRASSIVFFRWHAEIEDHLSASGLPHTILRPGNFMETHLLPVATVASQGIWYGMTGDGAYAYVAVDDIAEVAAVTLTSPGHVGAVYELTGPEAITMPQAAAQLSQVLSRVVNYVDVPADQYRATLSSFGLPDVLVGGVVGMYNEIREGHQATVTNWVERLAGRRPQSYREFAEAHKDLFSG